MIPPTLQLRLVGGAVVFFAMALAMVALYAPLAALELGASPATIGLLIASAYVLPLVVAMPIGGLIDRIGSRGPLIAACLVMTATPLAVASFLSLPVLFLSQLATGLAHLVFVVSAQRLVSTLGTGAVGERNFGWYSTFQSAGQMTGPFVGGALLDAFGARPAFALAAIGAFAALQLVLFLQPMRAVATPGRRARPYGTAAEIRDLLGNHGVRMAVVVSGGVLVVHAVRQSFLPVYLDALAFPATAVGLLISARGLVSMLVRPVMPHIVRLFGGRASTLLACVLALAFGIGVTSFVETMAPLLLASIFVGASVGVSQPLSVVTVADHAPAGKVGYALGFRLTGNRLMQVLAPVLIGFVAEYLGVRWSFLSAAAVVLLTTPFILRWRRAFDATEARLAGRADGEGGGTSPRTP